MSPDGARSAVVIGASIAGLLAASALADAGIQVLVVERDKLPGAPVSRRGVPQGNQVHVVLDQGWRALEDLLPGLRGDLVARGAACSDSGRMPWLGEYGWIADDLPGFAMVSVTRPLLELMIRRRALARPGVSVRAGAEVRGLSRAAGGWVVWTRGRNDRADLVVDGSGRSSRLPSWLAGLGLTVPAAEEVDAHLGYATRLYSAPTPIPLRTGIVIMGTPATGTGGLAMPVEHGRWLLMGGGFGAARPPRDSAGFEAFLARLRDPVLADLAERLEPCSDVAIHRQTGNRRLRFESVPDLPEGLLVVGDAGAAFNPIYGQGISVAATQAQVLRGAISDGRRPDHRLQARLSAVADLPWLIATGADRRNPAADHRPAAMERLFNAWTERTGRLVAAGDPAATLIYAHIYHLRAPLPFLLHPLLIASALRSIWVPERTVARPRVLDTILQVPRVRTTGVPTSSRSG